MSLNWPRHSQNHTRLHPEPNSPATSGLVSCVQRKEEGETTGYFDNVSSSGDGDGGGEADWSRAIRKDVRTEEPAKWVSREGVAYARGRDSAEDLENERGHTFQCCLSRGAGTTCFVGGGAKCIRRRCEYPEGGQTPAIVGPDRHGQVSLNPIVTPPVSSST